MQFLDFIVTFTKHLCFTGAKVVVEIACEELISPLSAQSNFKATSMDLLCEDNHGRACARSGYVKTTKNVRHLAAGDEVPALLGREVNFMVYRAQGRGESSRHFHVRAVAHPDAERIHVGRTLAQAFESHTHGRDDA